MASESQVQAPDSFPKAAADMIDFRGGRDNIITLEIGKQKQHFCVHRNILTQTSDFFRGAVKIAPHGDQGPVIQKPDLAVNDVHVYMNWLYNRAYSLRTLTPDQYGLKLRDGDSFDSSLVLLYSFACRIKDSELQNDVLDEMIARFENQPSILPSTTDVQYTYQTTGPGSLGLQLLAEFYARRVEQEDLKKFQGSFKAGFFEEVIKSFIENRRLELPEKIDRCKYHIQKSEECGGRKRTRTEE